MTMNSNSTFIFNLEWYVVLQEYPVEVRFEVYEAIMRYALSGTLPELKPLAKMAFSFIKKEMDYNRERYETTVEKRRAAGRNSAEAKKQKAAKPADAESVGQEQHKPTKSTNVESVEQNQHKPTKSTHNDNVNDNDNIYLKKINESDPEIREAYLSLFFGDDKQITLDNTLKKWETSREELRGVCEDALHDWTHCEKVFSTPEEAKKEFFLFVRYKFSQIKSTKYGKTTKNSGCDVRPSGARNAAQARNALDSSRQPGFGLVK